jgi:hypothetical protein
MQNAKVERAEVQPHENTLNNLEQRWTWYGYQDYKDGLGYRKTYDMLLEEEEFMQRCYEMGRCYAAILKYEWGVIPEWDPSINWVQVFAKAKFDNDTIAALNLENGFQLAGAKESEIQPKTVKR